MTRFARTLAFLAALAPAAAVAAQALPPLIDNDRVRDEFLAAAIGDVIRQECPTISARMVTVLRRAAALEDYAKSLGYTDEDIRAFRKDPAAKARVRALRDAYFTHNGVSAGDTAGYCTLGEREIADRTLIGALLRAR